MHLRSTFLISACCILGLLITTKAEAQDPRFSQFYASPLNLNPALTGVFEGQWRVVANYRELYASILDDNPYRTISASFDYRYRVMQGDYLSFGVSALRDEVGIANFSRTRGNFSLSFLKQLGGGSRYSSYDQYLVAGAQIGVGQRGFDFGNLWFSQQFNTEQAVIDLGSSSGENFPSQKTDAYLDFNAGILWYAVFEENRSIYFGGAYHHLNTPNISFLENSDEVLPAKWVGHVGGELPFNDQLSILPAVAVMGQNQSFSTTVGANFRYTNKDWREVAIRAGGWVHLANKLDSGMDIDAFIVSAILEMERWNLGISYDITTSTLATANNSRGAFELSLIYTHPEKSRYRVNCPNF